MALAGVAQLLKSVNPKIEGLWVQFPVTAHTKRQPINVSHTDVFLSLPSSF